MAARKATELTMDELIAWAEANGAALPENVTFKELPGRGHSAVASEQAAISVPLTIVLKLSDAVKGLGLDPLYIDKKAVNAALKLYLAKESSSPLAFHGPYIRALPSLAAINSPYVWTPQDLECLQGTNLGSSLKENLAKLVEEWWAAVLALPESLAKPADHFVNLKFYYEFKFYDPAQLHEYLAAPFGENWTSFPAYLWASMILKSRLFPSSLLGDASDPIDTVQPDVAMLIPVVDLLNHSPSAKVTWQVAGGSFEIKADSQNGELVNNYGRKGNEELLLAYGFCLPDNLADTVALRIKVGLELLPALEAQGIRLPRVSDYTTSVADAGPDRKSESTDYFEFENGLLFFIAKDHIPDDLVKVFAWLVRTPWETGTTLRMQLAGINKLRQALEAKLSLIPAPGGLAQNKEAIALYLASQKKILSGGVTLLKRQEAELLASHKDEVVSLKKVLKRDQVFARSLLVTMGVSDYSGIMAQGLADQVWLLWLVRCANRAEYLDQGEAWMPEWVEQAFVRMQNESTITAAELVQFQDLYEGLVIPMHKAVPEIYGKGRWSVEALITSTRVLDTVGFVRGKNQECLLVGPAN